jgi:hypothetical protein
MEELVNNTRLVDGDLVAAVKNLMPDASIEDILDKTRFVTLKRIHNKISKTEFYTVFHIVEELYIYDLTLSDVSIILHWVTEDDRFSESIREEAANVLVTKSFILFYRYLNNVLDSTNNKKSCCLPWKLPRFCSSNKSKTDRSPS